MKRHSTSMVCMSTQFNETRITHTHSPLPSLMHPRKPITVTIKATYHDAAAAFRASRCCCRSIENAIVSRGEEREKQNWSNFSRWIYATATVQEVCMLVLSAVINLPQQLFPQSNASRRVMQIFVSSLVKRISPSSVARNPRCVLNTCSKPEFYDRGVRPPLRKSGTNFRVEKGLSRICKSPLFLLPCLWRV